jgi:hypothetical protein
LTVKGADFLANPVDGEQCWLETYVSAFGGYYSSALNVSVDIGNEFAGGIAGNQAHSLTDDWYKMTLAHEGMNVFNSGVVAGAYWSVVGPGKNLQLASTPGVETYKFDCVWKMDVSSVSVDFYDELNHPG